MVKKAAQLLCRKTLTTAANRRAAEAVVPVRKSVRRPLDLPVMRPCTASCPEIGNPMGVGRDYMNLMLRKQTISDSNVRLRQIKDSDAATRGASPAATLTGWQSLPILREGINISVTRVFVRSKWLFKYSLIWPNIAARQPAARRRRLGELALARGEVKNAWLRDSAAALRQQTAALDGANAEDLAARAGFGLSEAQIDRLRLTTQRIEEIAVGPGRSRGAAGPGWRDRSNRRFGPMAWKLLKVRVPLGVVFFIYESRPNVTADAAAICVKSGNAVILARRQGSGPFQRGDRQIHAGSGGRSRLASRCVAPG